MTERERKNISVHRKLCVHLFIYITPRKQEKEREMEKINTKKGPGKIIKSIEPKELCNIVENR